ncbi:hypothetical protein WN944_025215 [Citrus x changshan-huyou]|uniref:Uncharacterized protein n=1 Tax=Citrus x changshan-huyou TaxID=2935761 RepID=A0AAP0QCQ9_9ROSI
MAGGYSRHRKSSSSSCFSIFNIFKGCCSYGGDDMSEDGYYVRRICKSDEDGRFSIAEPGIDGKASDFIARFYETRVSVAA